MFRIQSSTKKALRASACLILFSSFGFASTALGQSLTGAQPTTSAASSPTNGSASTGSDFSSLNASPTPTAGPSAPQTTEIKGTTGDRAANAKASSELAATPSIPNAPNDFQKFVVETTGKLLPLYGAAFFETPSARPAQGSPVPNDYPLGPGDELLIRAWGSIDIDLRAVVDRNGLINIPKVGTLPIAGVRAADAEEVIKNAVSKYFRGFSLNVTLGQLRTITVYMVGQAKRPGTYVVSSLSTLVTALSDTGGANQNGSLRQVIVKRAGKQIAELDFYAFLSKGEKSSDVKLIDGDVIVIPPADGFVALTGSVKSAAIYEVRNQSDSLGSLLELAGGLPVVADPRRAIVERIDPGSNVPRTVEEFMLDDVGMKRALKSGDLVTVLPIRPEFSNAVTLRGTFYRAVRVPYRDGMRITDLIPSKEALISSPALQRQNRQYQQPGNLADDIGNIYDEINWDYAVVERLNRNDLNVTLIPFNLGKVLEQPHGPEDIPLRPGDTITVLSADDVRVPIAKRRVFVRVEGEVQKPGVYQISAGESLIGVLQKAGGVTNDAFLFGSEFYRESVRRSQQENLNKHIDRVEKQVFAQSQRRLTSTVDAQTVQAQQAAEAESRSHFLQKLRELKATGRIALDVSPEDKSFVRLPDFRLENGDRLVVPNRPDYVQVFGAVNTEAALFWRLGNTVSDYLDQAGVSATADEGEVFVMRANGAVVSGSGRWFSSVKGAEVMPGDVIVVPEKVIEVETAWNAFVRGTKDISQVFANFGLAAAAIHTLNKD